MFKKTTMCLYYHVKRKPNWMFQYNCRCDICVVQYSMMGTPLTGVVLLIKFVCTKICSFINTFIWYSLINCDSKLIFSVRRPPNSCGVPTGTIFYDILFRQNKLPRKAPHVIVTFCYEIITPILQNSKFDICVTPMVPLIAFYPTNISECNAFLLAGEGK